VDVVFNPKDTHMMTGSVDGKLHIYDLMKKDPIKSIQAHKQVLSAIGIHETGGMVTASHDSTVCYWDL
jgi:mitogen-activated protein kinase organizer 1